MITVQTASRLHFGLLSLSSDPNWPDYLGQVILPARRFGGVGLMVQSPGIALHMRSAKTWSAQGPLAERALAFARLFVCCMGIANRSLANTLRNLVPQEIVIDRCAPEHAGLGTGTQLGLTLARGLSEAWKLSADAQEMFFRASGRGERSAVGFHGFFHGGFLVEAGQKNQSTISPLAARLPFPEDWRIVLVIPPGETGVHGIEEKEAFQQLLPEGIPLQQIEHLCRLTLLGLLPALAERDFKTFGEALFDYNSVAGQTFAKFQGGAYASPRIAELIQFIRGQGVAGVGQSSWGPTVFAIAEDRSRGEALASQIRKNFGFQQTDVLVTSACNHGAVVKAQTE